MAWGGVRKAAKVGERVVERGVGWRVRGGRVGVGVGGGGG